MLELLNPLVWFNYTTMEPYKDWDEIQLTISNWDKKEIIKWKLCNNGYWIENVEKFTK